MNDCPSSTAIVGLVDGALPPERRALVESHLQSCADCRQKWQERRDAGLFGEIRSAFAETAKVEASGAVDPTVAVAGYELQHELHRGGQGVVYRAVQKATKRTVAFKVLLLGAHATEKQRHRFEREVDLAAKLRHPNIVTIFDSGVAGGQPYYAMEFIDGQRLDEYASTARPSIERKLELFREICVAVGYAQRRGVIHRDLKPGNILIDSDGKPHILDFGLAKLTSDSDEALTRSGEFLGTLSYAAPEQTLGDPTLIDTRTDVYSLGVVLYELLTGRLPYSVSGSLAEAVANIANTPPAKIEPRIDADVETIVLKALAKEPVRRYDSAVDLGRDVEQYLHGLPIDARRDSTWYLLRKAAWRHRGAAVAAAMVLATLVIGLIVSLVFWQRAVADRNRAINAESEEHFARLAESRERAKAEFQAYVASLAAAMGAMDNHDVVDARIRLNQAPEKLRDWEWGYLFSRLDQSERTLSGHTAYLEAVAFSPDGRRIASASWDKTARVYDVQTGELLRSFQAPAELRALKFLADGRTIALGCWDGSVILWNSKDDKVDRVLKVPAKSVWEIAVSRDGAFLACAFSPSQVHSSSVIVWSTTDWRTVSEFQAPKHVHGVVFDADSRQLFVAQGNQLQRLDVHSGKPRSDWQCSIQVVGRPALDKAGQRLAVPGPGSTVFVVDATTGKIQQALRSHRQAVMDVAFSPDGTFLASAGRDKTIRLWDLSTSEEISVLCGHQWAVSSIAFSSTGSRLVSGSWDNSVKLWRPYDLPPPALRRHTGRVVGLAHHPREPFVASGGADHSICWWDVRGPAKLIWQQKHEQPVHAVAIHPSGETIASGSWDRSVRIWLAKDGRLLHTLEGHTDIVHTLAFSPDGKRLVSGSRDNTLRVWDAETGKPIHVNTEHTDHIHNVVYSPDGQLLVSAGHQTIQAWDATTMTRIATMKRSMLQEDFSLAFHPNGRWIAAGGDTQTVMIWDVRSGEEIVHLKGHSDEIHVAAFNSSGTRLVTASLDQSVRIWDTERWTEVGRIAAALSRVESLAFDPSGHRLYLGRSDGSITVLDDRPR